VTSPGAKPPSSGRTGGGGRAAAVFLAIAALIAAAFFFSFWGTNAEGLGRHDMGIALALSFAVPLTFYASIAWAALALVGTVVTLVKGRPRARWLAALAVSLLPGLFLLLVDLF
jgi:hypothetical protein